MFYKNPARSLRAVLSLLLLMISLLNCTAALADFDVKKPLNSILSKDEIIQLLRANGRVLKQNYILPLVTALSRSSQTNKNVEEALKDIRKNPTSLIEDVQWSPYLITEDKCVDTLEICTMTENFASVYYDTNDLLRKKVDLSLLIFLTLKAHLTHYEVRLDPMSDLNFMEFAFAKAPPATENTRTIETESVCGLAPNGNCFWGVLVDKDQVTNQCLSQSETLKLLKKTISVGSCAPVKRKCGVFRNGNCYYGVTVAGRHVTNLCLSQDDAFTLLDHLKQIGLCY